MKYKILIPDSAFPESIKLTVIAVLCSLTIDACITDDSKNGIIFAFNPNHITPEMLFIVMRRWDINVEKVTVIHEQ